MADASAAADADITPVLDDDRPHARAIPLNTLVSPSESSRAIKTAMPTARDRDTPGDEKARSQSRTMSTATTFSLSDDPHAGPNAGKIVDRRPSGRDAKLAIFAAWFAFMSFGASDGAIGACLIYMQSYYDISYTTVSLVFLLQVLGYGAMSCMNNSLLERLGRRWASAFGNGLLLTGFALISGGPPFPVVALAFVLLGFSAGVYESMFNAFLGTFRESNVLLGCLHGFYGLGAAISPILATQMIVHGVTWHYYYTVLLAIGVINAAVAVPAFWKYSAAQMYRDALAARQNSLRPTPATSTIDLSHASATGNGAEKGSPACNVSDSQDTAGAMTTPESGHDETAPAESVVKRAFTSRFCIVGAMYMFMYLGLEIGTGGWIVGYLVRVRGGDESAMGFVNSGYWLGLTASRFLLAVPSHWLGEWLATELWMSLSLAFVLVFWLARPVAAASVGVCLVGWFIGPTFPNIMQLATQHLPEDLHVAGIGFIASFGSVGGALLPFVIGILATKQSPKVVPIVLTALNVGCCIVWLFLPGQKYGTALEGVLSRRRRARAASASGV